MLVAFPLRSDAVPHGGSSLAHRAGLWRAAPDRRAHGWGWLPCQNLIWQVANGLRCSGHLRRLRALTSSSVRLIVTFFEIVGPR